ncbi:hypothetical protein F5B19DRAFT_467629 [Rostrohypoxylon terebratum]|nr:hypothetical protein F5B19DRAFT_467629 [Rostrohypoxylon terebratum]
MFLYLSVLLSYHCARQVCTVYQSVSETRRQVRSQYETTGNLPALKVILLSLPRQHILFPFSAGNVVTLSRRRDYHKAPQWPRYNRG